MEVTVMEATVNNISNETTVEVKTKNGATKDTAIKDNTLAWDITATSRELRRHIAARFDAVVTSIRAQYVAILVA